MPDDGHKVTDEGALVARFGPVARVFFLRHGLAHEAEDLSQRAILTTIEALRAGKVREPERIGAFVLGVCRNLVRARARADARRDAALIKLPEASETAPVDPVMARFALWVCLNALSARARDIVVRTYVEEDETPAIAADHKTTPGNVRVLRHRALAALFRCLQDKETRR